MVPKWMSHVLFGVILLTVTRTAILIKTKNGLKWYDVFLALDNSNFVKQTYKVAALVDKVDDLNIA
jgi:hypothetical protein